MQRYRFLLQPRWVILTVLVAAAIVGMLWAGFWQVRRLHERQSLNATVRARAMATASPVEQWLTPSLSLDGAKRDVEWRVLQASGTYDTAAQVLIRNRSYEGAPGYHVVTPLRLADGTALLVNRGWVPISPQVASLPAVPAPPSGTVTVEGRARATQERGAFGPSDPSEGVLTELARVDIARLRQQLTYPVLPAYVELTAQAPEVTQPLPRLLPLPDLDDGPHLAYAVQWFIFSALGVVGWVLVVHRQVKQDQRAAARAAAKGQRANEAGQPTTTPAP